MFYFNMLDLTTKAKICGSSCNGAWCKNVIHSLTLQPQNRLTACPIPEQDFVSTVCYLSSCHGLFKVWLLWVFLLLKMQ